MVGALESELDGRVVTSAAPGWVFIRAGVVGWRGNAVVIVGPGARSAASTLVAALLRAGAHYYSDRYAVLDLDGRVHPYPCPLWLSAGAHAAPIRCRAEELGAKSGNQALEIGTVLFAGYRVGAQPWFIPVTRAAALEHMKASMVLPHRYRLESRLATGKVLNLATDAFSPRSYRPATQLAIRKALAHACF